MKTAIYDALRRCLASNELVALATTLDRGDQMLLWPDGRTLDSLGDEPLDTAARALADEQWLSFGGRRETISTHRGEVELFVEIHAPPPRLVIVGAVHAAVALVHMANVVGFETIVVDPRTAFATTERFAHADHLLHDWPDEALEAIGVDANTFVALLSHDLKLDIPALRVALPKARYIGALGSKKTHDKRLRALADAGLDDASAARIHNPIGLDLGGRRAEEIAVSVLAEIVAVAHGRDARPIPT
ncbi:MAG: XdhC/CoxI family protein [Acidobacteriota bacterium]